MMRNLVDLDHDLCAKIFYAPGLKGLPRVSNNWIVRQSVCLPVHNSIPLTGKVQYLKFGWSYSNQAWTVNSSKGCSHFTGITCPRCWGGVKMWDFDYTPAMKLGGGILESPCPSVCPSVDECAVR